MMQKIFRCAFAVALVPVLASPAVAGEVKVTLNQGLVTIIADEAPVSRILAEWARVGQTRIVNGEKIMTVVSVQLVDMPERKALDILLRSASGYMAAERPSPLQGASAFDRIMILPFSRPPAASAVPASASMPQPFQPSPRPQQMMPQPQDEDGQPVMPPGMGPQTNQPAQTSPMPGMLPPTGTNQNPNATGQPPQQQTLPRPGFLPAPPGGTPNQPVPFGAPPATVKPPGGGGGGG